MSTHFRDRLKTLRADPTQLDRYAMALRQAPNSKPYRKAHRVVAWHVFRVNAVHFARWLVGDLLLLALPGFWNIVTMQLINLTTHVPRPTSQLLWTVQMQVMVNAGILAGLVVVAGYWIGKRGWFHRQITTAQLIETLTKK